MGNEFTGSETITFSELSQSKGLELLSKVQANPEITTENTAYVAQCVDRAASFIMEYCQLRNYPEFRKGYTKSAVSPSTDLTGLSSNRILITVNGSLFREVRLTLSNCTTGSNTASELQSVIREQTDINGFDEVTVGYDSTSGSEYYTITSGRYGEGSVVGVSFEEQYKHVAQSMKLSKVFGGTVTYGGHEDKQLDSACIIIASQIYAKQGAEGIEDFSLEGGNRITFKDLDPIARKILNQRRRLWVI